MNITPLVDVMLVLLVIFMIAAPVATGNLDMRIPQRTDITPPAPPPRVLVQVAADGSYTLEGQTLSRAGLAQALSDINRGAPNTVLAIRANPDADYQAFTHALSTARSSGLRNVTLAD